MHKAWLLAGCVVAGIASAGAQLPSVEGTLADLELRTSSFLEGREEMMRGFAQLPPNLRQLACAAYPARTDMETISGFKGQVALLKSPDNMRRLDPDQAGRLAAQKEVVSRLTPGVDCSRLPQP